MSGVAGEARASRRRLTPVTVMGRMDRVSLIAMGRRQLVRALHSRTGCSVVELYIEPGVCGLWLAALAAGHRLTSAPMTDVASLQVMQGQVSVHPEEIGAAAFPGDIVLGPLPLGGLSALTDAVVILTGTPATHRPASA